MDSIIVLLFVVLLIVVAIKQYYIERDTKKYKEHLTVISNDILNNTSNTSALVNQINSGKNITVKNLGVTGILTVTNPNSTTVQNGMTINGNSSFDTLTVSGAQLSTGTAAFSNTGTGTYAPLGVTGAATFNGTTTIGNNNYLSVTKSLGFNDSNMTITPSTNPQGGIQFVNVSGNTTQLFYGNGQNYGAAWDGFAAGQNADC